MLHLPFTVVFKKENSIKKTWEGLSESLLGLILKQIRMHLESIRNRICNENYHIIDDVK